MASPTAGGSVAPALHKWHHRPAHVFVPNTGYIVTAGTLHKQHYFQGVERLGLLQEELFASATTYGWELQAWALFSNHYHFIAYAAADAATLKRMLQRFHSATSRAINRLDSMPGRQVWFQFWDTCLTHKASYYARLNYVHNNAVHHGLASGAEQYEFCSAAWFATNADPAFYKRVCSYRYDKVKIEDDF
jgi:putative transposase